MSRRFVTVLAAGALLVPCALGLAACGKSSSSSGGSSEQGGIKTGPGVTKSQITLGVLTDLSGVFAALGSALTQGQQAYWKQQNANGGVCNRQVKLVVRDHGYDPQKAVTLYQDLSPNVAALQQLLGSPITAALLPSLERDSMYSGLAAWPPALLKSKVIEITGATYDLEAINGIDWLMKNKGLKEGDKIGDLYFEGDYGEGGLKGVKYAASKHNLTVVEQKIKATDLDMSGQVAAFKRAGVQPRGELWAAMLDTKESWDALVRMHMPDAASAQRIFDNALYQNFSTRFVQSHDYIAMERLYEIHTSGDYDLIVVDTPPTRNAIDFLEAPERMADFFSSRFLRWLTAPARSRVINFATRPFYQIADRILGTQFLQDISEFFLNFQPMYEGFVERARAVERLLHDRRTTFAVVTTLEGAPLREAQLFCDQLIRRDFHLGALVLNKTLPDFLLDPEGAATAARFVDQAGPIAAALADVDEPALADPARTARVLRTIGESFANFAVVAMREAELRAELARVPDVVVRIPSFEHDISDIESLLAICNVLFGDS